MSGARGRFGAFLRELVHPPWPEPIDQAAWLRGIRVRLWLLPTLASLNALARWLTPYKPEINYPNWTHAVIANVLAHASATLLAWRALRSPSERRQRWTAMVCCPIEQFTALTGIWLIGSITTTWGIMFMVVSIATYRVYYDARLGRLALVSALLQHGGLVALEATHVLPTQALAPQLASPVYRDPQGLIGGMIWIAVAYLLAWVLAGYVANRFRASEFALRELNSGLEQRVRNQVELLERTGRLRRYLAPQIVERILAADIDPVAVRERRQLTVMFADLRGFTEMVERVPPEVLADVLNHYFDEVAAIAFRHGGTIDKFIGDAVMVFFGAPEATGERDQAHRCVAMALEIQRRIGELGQDFLRRWAGRPLAVRIGIASGLATVGSFGARHRSDFTAVGAPVNRAARLEPLAPPGGILCDAATYELLSGRFEFAAHGQVQLKGFAEPVATFLVVEQSDQKIVFSRS